MPASAEARDQGGLAAARGGREGDRAIGVVIVDETAPIPDDVISELAKIPAVREVRLVRM